MNEFLFVVSIYYPMWLGMAHLLLVVHVQFRTLFSTSNSRLYMYISEAFGIHEIYHTYTTLAMKEL